MKRIAAGLLLAACAHASARAEDEMGPARLYARGARAEAVAALFGRDEDRRKLDLEAVARTRDGALLRAALMLHTDRALLEHVQAPVSETDRNCGRTEEDHYVLEVADRMIDRGELKDFVRRWFVAMALRSRWDLCLNDALHWWVKKGLDRYKKDPALLLVQGSAAEAAAQFGMTSSLDHTTGDALAAATQHARVTLYLGQARQSYDQALAADAGLLEARLRLGRTLWRLGKVDAARAQLELVAQAAPPPAVAYLAHLFLGRAYDDARRTADAERAYRAALALDPSAQAAAVGLAQLLGRTSPVPRELLARALEHAPRREPRDIFWSYPAAFGANGEEELARLREEASPTDVADPDDEERDTDSGTAAERSLR